MPQNIVQMEEGKRKQNNGLWKADYERKETKTQLFHRCNNYRNSVGSVHNVVGIWNPWIKRADTQQQLHVTWHSIWNILQNILSE